MKALGASERMIGGFFAAEAAALGQNGLIGLGRRCVDYLILAAYLFAVLVVGAFCSRGQKSLSDFFLGPLFIGCAHRINSVGAACSAHQGIMVSEVTDSDFDPLLTQSVGGR
jgi:hypothetical protein